MSSSGRRGSGRGCENHGCMVEGWAGSRGRHRDGSRRGGEVSRELSGMGGGMRRWCSKRLSGRGSRRGCGRCSEGNG